MDNFNEFDSPANVPTKETGSIISHALEIFKNTFLYCFLAVVIYFLLSYLIQLLTGFNTTLLMEDMRESGGDFSYTDIMGTPGFAAYTGVSFFIGLLLAPIFVGLIYIANKSNFKQSISVSDLFFAYKQNFLNIVIYALITQVLLTIAFLMCIIPMFLVLPFFMLGYPIIMFENLGAIEALKKSFSIAQQDYGTLLLTALLAGLISIAGLVLCCVGVYLTFPFFYVAMYSTYCAYLGAPRQLEQK